MILKTITEEQAFRSGRMQIHMQDAEAVTGRQIDEFLKGRVRRGSGMAIYGRTAPPLVAREFFGERREATEAIRIITRAK